MNRDSNCKVHFLSVASKRKLLLLLHHVPYESIDIYVDIGTYFIV